MVLFMGVDDEKENGIYSLFFGLGRLYICVYVIPLRYNYLDKKVCGWSREFFFMENEGYGVFYREFELGRFGAALFYRIKSMRISMTFGTNVAMFVQEITIIEPNIVLSA